MPDVITLAPITGVPLIVGLVSVGLVSVVLVNVAPLIVGLVSVLFVSVCVDDKSTSVEFPSGKVSVLFAAVAVA